MSRPFPNYDVDFISGAMSLRKPQIQSLKRLDDILDEVDLTRPIDLNDALSEIHTLFPTCTSFERDFISLTFALATGVGKTRLMGAFITYLYCQHGIKNFFVVAPNLTIYNKLKADLGDPSSEKYVFKGLGCFSSAPWIIADDDYKNKPIDSLIKTDINIFIFNISKFNSEDGRNMRRVNEYLGESFFDYLSNLSDLVVLMDESHHYHAEASAQALNELRPLLGLELTATPLVTINNTQVPFQNVVYEYPLSRAIRDGYTRTPFALTREDIDYFNFNDLQKDKIMITDGLLSHEKTKASLKEYALNNQKKIVKPFVLIVCRDTDHAETIMSFIQSNECYDGKYQDKVIRVHSNQRGAEKEENIQLLLSVERNDNPIEIVVHVNMLKEGWDVNNLYTIIPLRTATSRILREQTVGRGLRLPYGERVGNDVVDRVVLTAHDKFDEIVREAMTGDSIFKAGNVIKAEELRPTEVFIAQPLFELNHDELIDGAEQKGLIINDDSSQMIKTTYDEIISALHNIMAVNSKKGTKISETQIRTTVNDVLDNKDLGEEYHDNKDLLKNFMFEEVTVVSNKIESNYIAIPKIKVTDEGVQDYYFEDFDLDLSIFNHVPVENNIIIQSLIDPSDRERIEGTVINFEGFNPSKVILDILRGKPEIDYEKCSNLLIKLISQLINHFEARFGNEKMMNIVMMYKNDVSLKIYNQMMQHFSCLNLLIKEEVVGLNYQNTPPAYNVSTTAYLYDDLPNENIKSIVFKGMTKSVFDRVKFDSVEGELTFARVLEQDSDVLKWLKPAQNEFDIFYNRNKRYIPDFVVETNNKIYLVEVKAANQLTDPDVVAKKNRAIQYCKVASNWSKANGYKEWQYLFIPHNAIRANSSFSNLAGRFCNE